MKKITKVEPKFFTSYFEKERPETWEELSRAIGYDIRTYMLSGISPDGEEINPSEQNYQCAYTELDIEPEGSSSHVDHFRKQSMFQAHNYIFNWINLFTACNSNDYGAKHKDRNIQKEDYEYLINPAIDNPSKYITYNLLGKAIEASQDTNSKDFKIAKKTIDLFNLNERSLKAHRLSVSKQVQSVCNQLPLVEIKADIGKFDSFVEFVFKSCVEIDEN